MIKYSTEFESIFSGTCMHCYIELVNKPIHFTECINTPIGENILEQQN